ncbi:MAG: M20/M25/M40 family metallo-hydrolase [Thermoplasmatota archaeon]
MDADVELLRDLVSIPSPTGATEKAVEFLVDAGRARGLRGHRDAAGNAVLEAGHGPLRVFLVGHIDTVPGDLPVHFTSDGHLTGRGAVDAKGPLAAFVAAAARHRDSTALTATVVGCCDEEEESFGAKHLLAGPRPDVLIIGEPSGTNGLTIAYKGIVKIRYRVEEDLQHTGAPFPSVPDRGIAFWSAVQSYLAPLHGESLFDTPTVKLARFDTQLLPSGRVRCDLVGSARIPPDFDTRAFLAFLTERKGSGALTIAEVDPAWVADKNTPLARAFISAIRARGLTPHYVKKTGTSDMNILAPVWRCPVVAYGPGDASLDHTPHERIALADFANAVDVLDGALAALARSSTREP